MMEGGIRWCPHCMLRGEKKRLKLLQISDSFAARLCENEKCVNLGQVSSVSTLILQRKSSEIPNIKRKKTSQDPASRERTSAPDSKTKHLLQAQVSSRNLPQVSLWTNESALCWLDVCMCVLVSCGRLRECLTKLSGQSIIKSLCTVFMETQSSLKMPFCADTDAHSPSGGLLTGISNFEGQEHTNLNQAAVPCKDLTSKDLPPVNSDITEWKYSSANDGKTCNTGTCIPTRQQVPARTIKRTESKLTDCGGVNTLKPLDNIRSAIFQQLQPLLKCEAGQEESPLLALPLLLRLDRRIEEHFMSRYHLEFCCDACQYTKVDVNKKTVPTFTRVPADFSMTSPVNLQKCPECGSQDQITQLVFHSLPACMMMHFREGLPDSDLSKHLTFVIRGETYTLSSIIQYCRHPNHFVTYIRDCEANWWLKYDDLLPSPVVWQLDPPSIPASEIHIMVWERISALCTACAKITDDAMYTRCTSVKTTGPCLQELKRNWKPQPNGTVHCKQDGLALSTSSRSSEGTSSAGEKPAQVDKLTVACIDLTQEAEMTEDSTVVTKQPTESSAKGGPKCSHLGAHALFDNRTSAYSGSNGVKNSHTKQIPNERTRTLTSKNSCKPETNYKNTSTSVAHRPQSNEEPTFLKKLHARRKTKTDQESSSEEKRVASVLEKIPEQLMNIKPICSKNNMPTKGKSFSTDLTMGHIAQPSQWTLVNQQKLVAPHNPLKESLLAGTHNKAPVTFQPYGYSSALKKAAHESNNQLNAEDYLGTHNTSNSWKKRVGMYTSVCNPRKRARQYSTDDSHCEIPVHLGPPCSSVSSPSACSDISSVSDNQAFVSVKDDLANAIDELVLVVGSEDNPSISAKIPSPSLDMFLSELLTGAVSAGMGDRCENSLPIGDHNGQIHSTHGFETASLALTTTLSSNTTHSSDAESSLSLQHSISNSVGSAQSNGFLLTSTLQHNLVSQVESNLFNEGTLHTVSLKNRTPVPASKDLHCEVSKTLLTQPSHPSPPNWCTSHSVNASATPMNNYVIGGVDVNTKRPEGYDLTFPILGSNDATSPLLSDDIQEVLNSESNDTFFEMFST